MFVEGLVLRDLDLLVQQEGPAEGVQHNHRLDKRHGLRQMRVKRMEVSQVRDAPIWWLNIDTCAWLTDIGLLADKVACTDTSGRY